jgi:hypothetical protein
LRFIVENAGLIDIRTGTLLHHIVCRNHLVSDLGHKQQAAIPFLISPGGIASKTHFHTPSKSFKQWLGSR